MIRNPRGGKVAAQDAAVRATEAEVVAFSDANATWAPDALRKLVRNLADPKVAYVCGRLQLEAAGGGNQEGIYWRYELMTRASESRLGSVTGGNGSIYALRRADYVEVDPRFGHDLSLPYLMPQRGMRAVYEPDGARVRAADAVERDRVPPQGADVRAQLAHRPAREDAPPASRRVLARAHLAPASALPSGLLHLVRLGTSIALLGEGWIYAVALGLQLGCSRRGGAGVGIARYYVLVTWATVVSLWNYLRRGVPATWDAARRRRA